MNNLISHLDQLPFINLSTQRICLIVSPEASSQEYLKQVDEFLVLCSGYCVDLLDSLEIYNISVDSYDLVIFERFFLSHDIHENVEIWGSIIKPGGFALELHVHSEYSPKVTMIRLPFFKIHSRVCLTNLPFDIFIYEKL
jgi:hypothetical protein